MMTPSLQVFLYQCREQLGLTVEKIYHKRRVGRDYHSERRLSKILLCAIQALNHHEHLTPMEIEKIKEFVVRACGFISIIDVPHPDLTNVTSQEEDCFCMNFQDYFTRLALPGDTVLLPGKTIIDFTIYRDEVAKKNKARLTFDDNTTLEAIVPDHNEMFRIQGGDVDPLYGEAYHFTFQEHEDLLALLYKPATISLSIENGEIAKKGTSFTPQLKGAVVPNKDTIGQKRLNGLASNLPDQTNSFVKTMPAITDTTSYTYDAARDNKGDRISATRTVTFYFPTYFGMVDANFLSLNNAQIEAGVKAFTDERVQGKKNSDTFYTGANKRMCIAYPKEYGLPANIKDTNLFNILPSFVLNGSPRTVPFTFPGFASVEYYVFINNLNVSLTNYKVTLNFF